MNNMSFIELFFVFTQYTMTWCLLWARWKSDNSKVDCDTYIAEEMKEFSSEELRVNKIIDHNTLELYLDLDCEKKTFQNCLEDWNLRNSKNEY